MGSASVWGNCGRPGCSPLSPLGCRSSFLPLHHPRGGRHSTEVGLLHFGPLHEDWLTQILSRYLNILLGLSLLVSLVSLEYGSMSGERAPLVLFLILSIATVLCYWIWFLYLEHLRMDEREQEAGLAPLYLLLVLPVLLLYRSLQEMPYQREMMVVHVKNIEPVKLKEKRDAKIPQINLGKIKTALLRRLRQKVQSLFRKKADFNSLFCTLEDDLGVTRN